MLVVRVSRERFSEVIDELIELMFSIYLSTGGRYPKLEWLKPDQRPRIDDPNAFSKFAFYYEPFLRWRLRVELDELYVAYDSERRKIVGVIGLNYRVHEKHVPWIPSEYRGRGDVGFIELFAVHPDYQGRGIGSMLFDKAISRLKEMGKTPLLTTFPDLNALRFYERRGGKVVKRMGQYVIIEFK